MRQFELLFSKNADLTLLELISVVPKSEGMRYFQAHPIRNDGRYLVNVVIVVED